MRRCAAPLQLSPVEGKTVEDGFNKEKITKASLRKLPRENRWLSHLREEPLKEEDANPVRVWVSCLDYSSIPGFRRTGGTRKRINPMPDIKGQKMIVTSGKNAQLTA